MVRHQYDFGVFCCLHPQYDRFEKFRQGVSRRLTMVSIVSARHAVEVINDGVTLAIGGAGAGHAVPDRLMKELRERYTRSGGPRNLRGVHPCGVYFWRSRQ